MPIRFAAVMSSPDLARSDRRFERRLCRRKFWGRLGGGRRGPLRLTYQHGREFVYAVCRMVLDALGAGPAAEDPPDVLHGHDDGLADQPLLDPLESLDALRLLQRGLRLLEERIGSVVAPAHGVRARNRR